MGTTNRRQPVSFNIPKSPDYKFLNITNFRGLAVSSNPFELATNTASDCLNVYVDETNTLTTRPRLELFTNAPIDGAHIGTYSLRDGYLLHYETEKDGPIMWIFKDGKLDDNKVSGTIPVNKCKCFEHGDKIYLLDGSRYMVISDNVLSDVEGYVPVTSVVDISGNKKEVEKFNLLSDKYKETHVWDGVSSLSHLNTLSTLSIKNDYYTKKSFNGHFIPLICYDDYSSIGYYYDDGNLVYKTFAPNSQQTDVDLSLHWEVDKSAMMTTVKGFWYVDYNILYRCVLENGVLVKKSYTHTEKINNIESSPNGSFCVFNDSNGYYCISQSMTEPFSMGHLPRPDSNYWWRDHILTDLYLITCAVSMKGDVATLYVAQLSTTNMSFTKLTDVQTLSDDAVLTATASASVLIFQSKQKLINDPIKYIVFNNLSSTPAVDTILTIPANVQITEDGVLYGVTHANYEPSKLFIVRDYMNPNRYDADFISYIDVTKIDGNYISYQYKLRYANVFVNKYIVFVDDYAGQDVFASNYYVFNTTPEPALVVTRRLIEEDVVYEDWDTKRKNLFKSHVMKRFDNNYWLASGNMYYRSANNDPTYFPTTEYHELGDSNEEITGFNLANDSTLIAYKKNKLYLIQPFTSSLDTTEYTITESKNTVGNTAIDAPIVTTLTEIPLQINNDGIYGLSQLVNVSAVERIADLLSEPINDRWLNEDESTIKKAQTLNRLYWTYIVLPCDKENVTKIYLLDNRTNSWYYWELPVVVSDSFIKDNRVEFVDTQGTIYYLTSTDIINKNFETQLVTEYYDANKQLIPWSWQSQILPLGTMNYSKRLVNTTFILTDTDDKDGYGLNYSFKVFRKLASSVPEKEITGDLTLVRSLTTKTNISKFGFLQIKLSNITEDSQGTEVEKAYRNNKLRLVGLGLKYVLLEGLIR